MERLVSVAVVLYIEDDANSARLLAKRIRRDELDILLAVDGQSGIDAAVRYEPDVILLDYMLPDMDGFEVMLHLRRLPQLDERPVIMITADSSPLVREEARRHGFSGFLTKPVGKTILINLLHDFIDLED